MANYKRVVLTEKDHSVKEKDNRKQSDQTDSITKQIDKFDTSYTSKKLNDLYNEFDSITFDAPSISSHTISATNTYTEEKSSVSIRTKIYLSAGLILSVLFIFLSIYNIFVINSMNANIDILQEEVSAVELDYNAIYQHYKNLNNTDKIIEKLEQLGFGKVDSSSIFEIPLMDTANIGLYQMPNNWFDSVCTFIKGLFGG